MIRLPNLCVISCNVTWPVWQTTATVCILCQGYMATSGQCGVAKVCMLMYAHITVRHTWSSTVPPLNHSFCFSCSGKLSSFASSNLSPSLHTLGFCSLHISNCVCIIVLVGIEMHDQALPTLTRTPALPWLVGRCHLPLCLPLPRLWLLGTPETSSWTPSGF